MTVLAPTTAERIRSACARGGGAMLAVEGLEPRRHAGAPSARRRLLRHHRARQRTAERHGRRGGCTRRPGGAGDDRLRAASVARTGPLAGVDPRPAAPRPDARRLRPARPDRHREPQSRSAAGEHGRGAGRPRRHPVRADAAGDRIRRRRRLDRRRVRRASARCSTRARTRSARWSPAGCSTSSPPTARWSTDSPTGCPTPLRRGRVRPLGLDRYGVQLRVENEDGDHDVRLPFATPVDDVTGLSQAIRVLMGCPFLNGLRARRI